MSRAPDGRPPVCMCGDDGDVQAGEQVATALVDPLKINVPY
ncbi:MULTISPECIES: hypothetical protein [unclassified Mesorhizobium]|nr:MULTISPECIES: hypothetical protein [unclassified Mesorhizobium]